jgi:hypothetical protein
MSVEFKKVSDTAKFGIIVLLCLVSALVNFRIWIFEFLVQGTLVAIVCWLVWGMIFQKDKAKGS